MSRLNALDLFRFFAAMGVVFYHYFPKSMSEFFPGTVQYTHFGYLGVPLFFMISGFVIAVSAEQRKAIEFIISRAARLLPAFWIGATITALLILWEGTTISWKQYLGNLTMLNDYFGIRNIDEVYWTLQAEIKFYGCIFLLLCFGVFSQYKIWLSIWLLLTILFNIFHQPFFMGWFINPSYSPYFISGVAFYLIWRHGISTYTSITLTISTIFCLLQAYQQAGNFIPQVTQTDKIIAAATLFIFHGLFLCLSMHKLNLKSRPLYTALGAITYPLYLLHNHAGKIIMHQWHVITDGFYICLMIIFMLIFSYAIHLLLEQHIARWLKRGLENTSRRFV